MKYRIHRYTDLLPLPPLDASFFARPSALPPRVAASLLLEGDGRVGVARERKREKQTYRGYVKHNRHETGYTTTSEKGKSIAAATRIETSGCSPMPGWILYRNSRIL